MYLTHVDETADGDGGHQERADYVAGAQAVVDENRDAKHAGGDGDEEFVDDFEEGERDRTDGVAHVSWRM